MKYIVLSKEQAALINKTYNEDGVKRELIGIPIINGNVAYPETLVNLPCAKEFKITLPKPIDLINSDFVQTKIR